MAIEVKYTTDYSKKANDQTTNWSEMWKMTLNEFNAYYFTIESKLNSDLSVRTVVLFPLK